MVGLTNSFLKIDNIIDMKESDGLSAHDIGNGFIELNIPIYGDNMLSGIAYAVSPMFGNLPESEKRKIIFDLSGIVTNIANQIIYYTLDHLSQSLQNEQNNVAYAFLQRATSFHISNHKLSLEGITTERHGKVCILEDEYKTMPLTRSVYEHLAMFYYLFNYTTDKNQREIIWNSWILRSEKNRIKGNLPEFEAERQTANKRIEDLKKAIHNNDISKKCTKSQIDGCLKGNAVFTVIKEGDKYITKKLSYDTAWQYLYGKSIDLALNYGYFSMHSHPTYIGLSQFYSQQEHIEYPLYESCHFLAYLCRLFMQQFQIDKSIITDSLTEREREIFSFLSNEII